MVKSVVMVVAVVLHMVGCAFDDTAVEVSQELEGVETPVLPELPADVKLRLVEEIEAKLGKKGDIETMAPAPPLSYLQIRYVSSPAVAGGAWISYGDNVINTYPHDHGGGWIGVATVEYGYGYSYYATMAGGSVPQYNSQAIVSGTTVIGYVRYWLINGSSGGQFNYQNTSTNYPWNTMSDWMIIQ